MKQPERPRKGIFSFLFSFFNIIRMTILNLLFWGVVAVLAYTFIPRPVAVPEEAVLSVDPVGTLTERNPSDDRVSRILGDLSEQAAETPVFLLSRTLRMAAGDSRIRAVFLDLSFLDSGSLAALQELREDILFLKDQGKRVIAWSEYYNLSSWYLASAADEVLLDPMGAVSLPGFSLYRMYFGEALEKWNIDVDFIHAGQFKSYGEAYTSSSMSEDFKRENRRWLGSLWTQYTAEAAAGRGLNGEDIKKWIDDYPELLAEKSEAQAALAGGLIDRLATRQEMEAETSLLCEGGRSVSWWDYSTLLDKASRPEGEKGVAVLNATGEIHTGQSMPWSIGSDTLVSDLDWIASRDDVRALVLRLDTGGGSAFASELIRRKLQDLKRQGLPVVISMGGVTASGGYWIATAGDEIWTDPGSITGSIGVFSLITGYGRFAAETLNLHSDGVGTTWMAGQERGDQPLTEESRRIYQAGVDKTYDTFLTHVAESRSMSKEKLRPYAEGRIWSGLEAVDIGLADHAGTLQQAIASAASLAGLEDYHPVYLKDKAPTARDYLSRMTGNMLEKSGLKAPLDTLRELTALKPGRVYALSGIRSPGQK